MTRIRLTSLDSALKLSLAMPSYFHGSKEVSCDCPARLELMMIRRCALNPTQEVGLGLSAHVKRFASLAWPDFYWHRWSEMLRTEVCAGGTLAVWGPASSQKTGTIGAIMLCFYWALADQFTGLCSTTDLNRLELRIWGDVKKWFRKGKERYPWLPGHMTDSRQRITTDAKNSADGRDFRNGIMGLACKRGGEWQGLGDYSGIKNKFVMLAADECFPAGTLVDTASEPKRIETIRPGDWVRGALGLTRVVAVSKRRAKYLVRVICIDGRMFRCTSSHPILTNHGWKNAVDLDQSHYIVSQHEAMRILSGEGSGPRKAFLRELLSREVCPVAAFDESEALHQRTGSEDQKEQSQTSPGSPGVCGGFVTADVTTQSYEKWENAQASLDDLKKDWLEALSAWRKRYGSDQSRAGFIDNFYRSQVKLCCEDWDEKRQRVSAALQNRPGMAGVEARGRSGWSIALRDHPSESGPEERTLADGAWVGRVEIQECENTKRDGFSGDGVEVYNLQVEGHPSYSVNGLLVHNCHMMEKGFLEGAANLKSNDNSGRFTGIYIGNLIDLETPLGEAAEPKCGWDALPDSDVSRIYPTKFFEGRAVQLVGRDSPNFDFPEGQEPYEHLIGRRFLRMLKHDYGEGSPLYIAQAGGTIPRSSLANRILTREVCHKFNAFEAVTWGNKKLTKLYCMDVSYTVSHGDRSVGAGLCFGEDVEGRQRLAFIERAKVFQLHMKPGQTVEECLAEQAKEEMDRMGIGYSAFFYDGTGRSSFTAAAMRLMGTSVQPVEFGGRPSERPNFIGRKFTEGVERGNLMPCSKVFGKFVSELWFAWRYVVEADQLRNLPEDVAKDGYMRLWSLVAGNKLDVEPKSGSGEGKQGMKDRIGRSPDHGDCFVTGLEGARRLGFVIGNQTQRNARGAGWLQGVRNDYQKAVKEQELTYA